MNKNAIDERRAYGREWRARNRERVRRYNAQYWERRAKRKEGESDAEDENGSRSHEACQSD